MPITRGDWPQEEKKSSRMDLDLMDNSSRITMLLVQPSLSMGEPPIYRKNQESTSQNIFELGLGALMVKRWFWRGGGNLSSLPILRYGGENLRVSPPS